jgi:hypothetical protein
MSDSLFEIPEGWYRIVVELAVTAGPGGMTAAAFLESLRRIGDRLDMGGTTVTATADQVTCHLVVRARGAIPAVYAAIEAAEAVTTDRRLEVRTARVLGIVPGPPPLEVLAEGQRGACGLALTGGPAATPTWTDLAQT